MKEPCVKLDTSKVVILVMLKLSLKVLASLYFLFLYFIYINQLNVFFFIKCMPLIMIFVWNSKIFA